VTTAPTVCRSCGSAPHEGSRFCDACGSRLMASVEAPEYKQVTVLFADVVRSMDIAGAMDIERLREIMTELLERSAAVVHRYGGAVEHTGDGIMALFGAPVALEDHAFRACIAALAIQAEAVRLADEVARTDGLNLQLRVGLNSGRVIAGEIGSGSLGYAATGEHVGMAQRMEATAPAGRGAAVRIHRASRRARLGVGRTGVGAYQGHRRTGARTPTDRDRPARRAASTSRGEPGGSALGDGGP
jgi:class 3 adenylate cyclase